MRNSQLNACIYLIYWLLVMYFFILLISLCFYREEQAVLIQLELTQVDFEFPLPKYNSHNQ